MTKQLRKTKILTLLILLFLCLISNIQAQNDQLNSVTGWQSPPEDIMKVLYAPKLPWVWTSPSGAYLFLADPMLYPSLNELAGPMHKLAGMRINPKNNAYHGRHGGTSPRLVSIENKKIIQLNLPEGAEVHNVEWTADGLQFALTVGFSDHFELWVGTINGDIKKIDKININPLFGNSVTWMPDQKRLLVRRIPNNRGEIPKSPVIPIGPEIMEGDGASARSTYEARNLLTSAHDDKLFEYFSTSELVIVNVEKEKVKTIGKPALYFSATFSPDGKYILSQRLVGPWSHEVAWWRFAREIEVRNEDGKLISEIASLPVFDAVPVHGVILGRRNITWRPTTPSKLFWVEALDGGDPKAEVSHRDKLMSLEAPFSGEPKEIFKAKHRIQPWMNFWGEDGTLMLTERERIRRWKYTWLIDSEKGTSRLWFDINEGDRYNAPGYPVFKRLSNGRRVFHEKDNHVYFRGSGGTEEGDRPFLDLRNLENDQAKRLFRCDAERYEYFVAFAGGEDKFVLRSESSVDVPNYYLATFDKNIEPDKGEASMTIKRQSITKFEDPAPILRKIKKRIVHYQRADSIPLSFKLHLPPGYKEGTPLPTVVYAYPQEFSGAKTAGQVTGSTRRFIRLYGPSHLYFLLRGYAVLDRTSMPMIGDPETTYNTFVPQLVADAEAAVKKAIEIGVADPDRIGIIGHSHGGLMVANLLAHTDLFSAGIARSGSYNKTNQPFGFQSERRSLFDAKDVYIQVSPTFFADKVNEPILIIHGNDDSNPGTLTFQSKVFYEAVRGSGGNARLVLLPFEDHGYRAKESIEHVLWEQLRWFDKYVKKEE